MGKDNQENAIEKYFVRLIAKETHDSMDDFRSGFITLRAQRYKYGPATKPKP